jgi:molybdopterin-containing oxidoreductase family membrane subunit
MSNETLSTRSMPVLVVALLGVLICGWLVIQQLMGQGHAAFNATSTGLMWGLPIVTYDYLLVASTGLAMLGTAPLAWGVRDLAPIARRCLWLAFATLIAGVVALFLELGYPWRALVAIPLSFQVKAPLFWKALGVGVYAVTLIMLLFTNRESRGVAKLCFGAAVFATLLAGLVFGLMAMRPLWFGPQVSLAFVVEAALAGVAFAIFFTYFAHGFSAERMNLGLKATLDGLMRMLFVVALTVYLLFFFTRLATGLWSNADGLQVWKAMTGSVWFHLELWIGLLLPLLLMAAPTLRGRADVQIAAALLVMIGLFIGHYEFIVGGQLVPLFKGSWVRGLIDYAPSATEWLTLLLAAFVAILVQAWGERRSDEATT